MKMADKINSSPIDEGSVNKMENLKLAGKQVEQCLMADNNFPHLADRLRLTDIGIGTKSGLIDADYPQLNVPGSNIKELKTIRKSPIPREILSHLSRPHSYSSMGVFPEIRRAWISIDTDLFLWDFECGPDIIIYDGQKSTIQTVGLVKPKAGVFKDIVHYLLVIASHLQVDVLGITHKIGEAHDEIILTSDTVLYSVPSDGILFTTIVGSNIGRIFMGSAGGELYELEYYSEYSWWGKQCKKVNHSSSIFSKLLPSIFSTSITGNDVIINIAIDNSRHVLYTLTLAGTIEMFDLGIDGMSTSKKATYSHRSVLYYAEKIIEEASTFGNVMHISAIEKYESSIFYLVAITTCGARFYFSASTDLDRRPYTITISHVRIPPGYTGNGMYNKPSNISAAYYNKGTMLMVSQNETETSKLCCLSSDMFVFSSVLSEMYCFIPADGTVFKIYRLNQDLLVDQFSPDPPLVVRQHYEPSTKFVCLTTQGVEIIRKLRPVDVLAQCFADGNDPSSEVIRQYLQLFSPEEGCTMLLLLACQETRENIPVCEQATRAFFLYGGEPVESFIGEPKPSSTPFPQHTRVSGFNPHLVSTPMPQYSSLTPFRSSTSMMQLQSSAIHQRSTPATFPSSPIEYSAKHNSLYKYVCRILRPLWNEKVAQCAVLNGEQLYLEIPFTGDRCTLANSYLLALQEFFKKHTNIFLPCSSEALNTVPAPRTPKQQSQDVYGLEYKSLNALKLFVNHVSEVIGLWKILYEHKFPNIIAQLNEVDQSVLSNTTFRELFLTNFSLYPNLIDALFKIYIGDSSAVHSISNRLRETCPSIYCYEDSACTKAMELIVHAKMKQDMDTKKQLLSSSLRVLKEVVPKVKLEVFCGMYLDADYLDGIYELCYSSAKQIDKHDVAVNYYRNKDASDDSISYAIYVQRMKCYTELISSINKLYLKSCTGNNSVSITSVPGMETHLLSVSRDSRDQFEELLDLCFSSDDELLHCSVYEWMISNNLQDRLSEIVSPYLEYYLQRPSTIEQFGSRLSNNLLWKYYERVGNHVSAAQTLYSLANEYSEDCTLQERIEYLSHALVCMRIDKSGAALRTGAVTHEIEEVYHVATVQRKVQKALIDMSSTCPEVEPIVRLLNKNLYSLTRLCEEFVSPFNLSECMLAIIDCSTASFGTKDVIHSTWEHIILSELKNCISTHPDDKMNAVATKVSSVLKTLRNGSPAVDIEYLVFQLELTCCRLGASKDHVVSTMVNLGIPYSKLITLYDTMNTVNNECWSEGGDEFHVVAAIGCLSDSLAHNIKLTPIQKKPLALRLHDMVTHCLNLLYSRQQNPDITKLVQSLKIVLKKLSKLF